MYEYKPLETVAHIRILILQQQFDTQLTCTIEHVDHATAGFYALLYAWGSPDTPFNIQVVDIDGRKLGYIPLTKTLNDAMRDLRDSEGIQLKKLWADQICIYMSQ
jgi:hypothetical protein